MSLRPPNEANTEWDGVIRHTKHGPGQNGYKNHGCRCPGCCDAGAKMYERRRRTERERLAKIKNGDDEPTHGVTGYRQFGCRCEICASAGAHFNQWAKEHNVRQLNNNEPLDWSEVEHLKPGHNVRNRARDSPNPDLITPHTTTKQKENT
jgi:hypothetical protein